MDIAEVRKKKAELEEDIKTLLGQFHTETGVFVSCIGIDTNFVQAIGQSKKPISQIVTTEVSI